MAEVTCYVALPFIVSDEGIAAGEPTECFRMRGGLTIAGSAEGRSAGLPSMALYTKHGVLQRRLSRLTSQ